MDRLEFLKEYNSINNQYKKKLVFGIGLEAGFYSEINNMILAIIYCLNNNIKFQLHSSNANFKIEKGWIDFFYPFCTEKNNWYTDKFDHRFGNNKSSLKTEIIKYIGKFYGIDYMTHHLFDDIHSFKNEQLNYDFKKLSIKGDIQETSKHIISNIYTYNKSTHDKIENQITLLNLPNDYIGFHIRGGDKDIEHEIIEIDKYISKAESTTDIRNCFVYTDDYSIIEYLRTNHSNWQVFTLTNSNEKGYFHTEFLKEDSQSKQNKLLKMFTSVEILSRSKLVFCTYSSNIGMFLGMRVPEKTIGIDFDKWRIW